MKKLTALLISCFCFLFAKADTFIVTSNADSGPGTLREAITLANANGTATADFIHFNIPQTSFNLRIINLVNELPSVTSNITIDGTTQPGSSYAVTDARICIKKNEYAPSFSMLKIENAQNVNIYGLYLYYGYWRGLFGIPWRSNLLFGINLANSNNIEIGAPGKGNVINGTVHGIYSNSDSCRNISIRSNYIGHGRYYTNQNDDIDEAVLGVEACITFAQVKDITIGGSEPREGNVFGSTNRAINIDTKYTTGNGFIKIRNNIFGRGFDKQTLINVHDLWDSYINIGRSRQNPSNWTLGHFIDYRVELLDNDIPSHVRFGYISDSIIVQRNKFEEDFRNVSGPGLKLHIWLCPKGGLIGGTDAVNANTFQKKKPGTYFASLAVYGSGPFTILKNIFDCNSTYGSTTSISNYTNTIPFVQVDVTTADSVTGRASPNTGIDLYYDDPCTACEGRIYIAHVMADAAGRWKYVAPIQGTIVATATSSLGSTSEFSKPQFNTDSVKVKHPTCGKDNGSITGIKTEGADTYFWIRYRYPQKDTVSRTIDMLNAGPGEYILYAVHGGTCINTFNQSIVLEDKTPKISTSWATVSQPSCGRFNGYIGGLAVQNGQYSTYKWIDNQGQTIGTQNYINTLGPGTYRFIVADTTSTGGCSDTATFVLTNQSGPSLYTDSIRISNAVCSRNGSITNIRTSGVTGNPFICWYDSVNNSAGRSLDLLNAPPGKYYLKFKDASACDTIITPFYTIGNTGEITIDTSGKIVAPGKCSGNMGSIKDITVTGGSTYQWENVTTGVIVGNSLPVSGLAAGTYRLTVTNTYGCSETSPAIVIPAPAFLPIAVTAWGNRDANCGQPNGIIEAQQFSKDTGLYTLTWVDSTTGQNAGSVTKLQNVYGGTYLLFATDSNGCRQQIAAASIANLPLPYFDYSALQIIPDQCLTSQGAIRGLVVKDMRGVGSLLWLNSSDDPVGNTLNIQNLQQGTYRLKATDQVGCSVTSNPLTVDNVNTPLSPPQYDDQTILKNTSATLLVKNNRAGTYLLYDDPLATVPVGENTTGIFTTPMLHADKVYYIRFVNGVCQSNLVAVHVKVVDKAAIYVPTAFTPNGDGKNDLLKAIAYGRIRLLNFSVYNRWGQLVFSTGSFNTSWNGRVNGKPVDTGVYVWMIKAVDEISGLSMEQKGTVLLIK